MSHPSTDRVVSHTWAATALIAIALTSAGVASGDRTASSLSPSNRLGRRLLAAARLANAQASAQGVVHRAKRAQDTPPDDPADDDRISSMGRLARLSATGRLKKRAAAYLADRNSVSALDDEGEDGPAGGQAETSIAVDSTGQHIVIGFNDTRGFSLNPLAVSGFMYSDDGGATFVDGGQLPVTVGTTSIGATLFPQASGDPDVKYLGGSTFVYFEIVVDKFSATTAVQTMGVHRSTDNGHTWQGPFIIPPASNPNGLLSGASPRDAADKEFADVDPDTGRVLLTWSNFTPAAPGGVEILSTFSDNLATATPPTWSPRVKIAAAAADGQASIPRFAGNGSNNAYVAWRRFPGGNNQNVGFARSTDNGVTFSAPVNLAAANFFTMDQVLGNDRVNTSPALAVDNSPGPNKGNIYVVYANNDNHDGADIAFQRSTDQGLTFSAPVLMNSRPGLDSAQWFPWVNVDRNTGRVYVFYYDQGIAIGGDLTETTYLFSDDGGTTWSKPMPLTDRPFHAAYGNDTGQPNLGDYNQAVAQNGELFAVWAGTTPVGFADGQPSTSFTTPDVVFKRLPEASTRVWASLNGSTFTDSGSAPLGGNGHIDPGEAVHLQIQLQNYVTNGGSPITGINATLSTSTAGVLVTQPSSAYPNLAAGASGANAADYVVTTGANFVPGTHIEFVLTVSSAQGSTALPFTQSTGTPVATTIFSENFDGVGPGTLPAGWATSHGGGNNTVPWTTSNTGLAGLTSNGAFHRNANDGLSSNHTRFERLFSPVFQVPANSDYVTMDFDVVYDTEDDPSFNILAYDGFLLRITDQTAGRTLRSNQIESFAEEFTTGGTNFYPKHMPRSSSAAYLQDLSAWAGDSGGSKHVHLKLPGMAGSSVQLRWEYTQDGIGICSDVRPGHTCGVLFDNVVVQSVNSASPTSLTLTSSPNPSAFGQGVVFTATATTTGNAFVTDGQVTFKEGATVLAAPTTLVGGQATFTKSDLSVGDHTITAEYSSTTGLFASASASVLQLVRPGITISDVSVSEGNTGFTLATFQITLSLASTSVVTVNYATADGTATVADSDYVTTNGSVVFVPGTTSGTITVPVLGDIKYEPDETFFVNLSSPLNALIVNGQGKATITNDDAVPAISIDDVTVFEGDSGTTSAMFTVTLSNPSAQIITIDFGTADGTATAGSDYVTTAGTLTFASGATTQSIIVPVIGDLLNEPDETFVVTISNPVNATIGNGLGVGMIQNDDAQPSLSITSATVIEGDSGTTNATFTVALSNPSAQTITVGYTTADGTATAGSDYTTTAGTLTFAPGVTTMSIIVPVIGDLLREPNETFFVNLSSATNAIIAGAQGIGTIIDNDPQPSISINDVSVVEGSSGTTNATFAVSLSAPSAETITVNFATADGTATAGSDYNPTTGTLTFAPSQTTKTIAVGVFGDTLNEFDEIFIVNLSNSVNATIADGQGIGTIANDDPLPRLSISSVLVTEGSDGGTTPAVFTVSLSDALGEAQASGQIVAVNFSTADGTAAASTDYISNSGALIFLPGETTKLITIGVVADIFKEADETFFVNLSGATNAVIAGAQGTGTIRDDDPVPTISINDVSVLEGNSGTTNATFTVKLSTQAGVPITVDYATTDGTATAGTDYTPATGVLTFNPGETTKTITVVVNGDTLNEPDETFFVNLSNPINATIADSQGVGTILNDDAAGVVAHIDQLIDEVEASALDRNNKNKLEARLRDIRSDVLAGQKREAIRDLNEFIDAVRTLVRHNSLPAATGNLWIAQANTIIGEIGVAPKKRERDD